MLWQFGEELFVKNFNKNLKFIRWKIFLGNFVIKRNFSGEMKFGRKETDPIRSQGDLINCDRTTIVFNPLKN